MKINVTFSSSHKRNRLIKKTRKYLTGDYNKKIARDVFEGKNKGYYIFIQNKFIQIEVIDESKENIAEIKNYLEFLFYNSYIGISYENNQGIELRLNNVECFKL